MTADKEIDLRLLKDDEKYRVLVVTGASAKKAFAPDG